jgi:hypothetical protein
MALRVGFDLDGVLADLLSAYLDVERQLFDEATASVVLRGPKVVESRTRRGVPDGQTPPRDGTRRPGERQRRGQAVWRAIESTTDFWTMLDPLEPGLVRRIHDAAIRYRWEVFFVTQRPETAGETAQRQSQRWLVVQGFDLPSVIVLRGPRGRLAQALGLDFLVDDTYRNCVDVRSDSKTRVVLVDRAADPKVAKDARRLGVAVVPSAAAAVDLLEQATESRSDPTLFHRLARKVGWEIR